MTHSFGQAVRERRLELGMTLQEVADRMGCTHQYVSKLESNKVKNPSFKTTEKVAKALDASGYIKTFSISLKRVAHSGYFYQNKFTEGGVKQVAL